jgi:hypothetical protein
VPVNAWYASKNIYLNTTESGAGTKADLYHVPVLIRLNKDNFDFISARQSGDDIRFAKPDNTLLPYQIERWDAAQEYAEIWVKIDTVYANDSTHYFTMRWGNTDAQSMSNGPDVFDTSAGFCGVWHMNDDTGSLCHDATGNGFHGQWYGDVSGSVVDGMVSRGRIFNGTSQYIVVPNTATSKLNFPQGGNYSISAWVSTLKLDTNYQAIVCKNNLQYALQIDAYSKWEFFEFHSKSGWESTTGPALSMTWTYLTGVRNGPKQYLYVDGVCVDSTITNITSGNASNSMRDTSYNVCIGKRSFQNSRYFNGSMDEVRIHSTSLSADWVKLCYMNQRKNDALVVLK